MAATIGGCTSERARRRKGATWSECSRRATGAVKPRRWSPGAVRGRFQVRSRQGRRCSQPHAKLARSGQRLRLDYHAGPYHEDDGSGEHEHVRDRMVAKGWTVAELRSIPDGVRGLVVDVSSQPGKPTLRRVKRAMHARGIDLRGMRGPTRGGGGPRRAAVVFRVSRCSAVRGLHLRAARDILDRGEMQGGPIGYRSSTSGRTLEARTRGTVKAGGGRPGASCGWTRDAAHAAGSEPRRPNAFADHQHRGGIHQRDVGTRSNESCPAAWGGADFRPGLVGEPARLLTSRRRSSRWCARGLLSHETGKLDPRRSSAEARRGGARARLPAMN